MEKILLSWSSGKDSAFALYQMLQSKQYQIAALLTTITREYDRVSMHGVQTALLDAQADSVGLPLEKIWISPDATNQEYEYQMRTVLQKYQQMGIQKVAFGDLFLQEVRQYREKNLAQIGMDALFPLWGKDTTTLCSEIIKSGIKAVITCVDTQQLDAAFTGREIDPSFLADLPAGIDPCGENGEFHSYVYDGPMFANKIRYSKGETILRDNRFSYIDLELDKEPPV